MKLYYVSEKIVKDLLNSINGDRVDSIEKGTSKNIGLKGAVSFSQGILKFFQAIIQGEGSLNSEWSKTTHKEFSIFDHGTELLKSKKFLESIDILDQIEISQITPGYYFFSSMCNISERFEKIRNTQISLSWANKYASFTGSTSIDNWISESYLNNLLDLKTIDVEGLLKVIDKRITQHEKPEFIVQFVIIGEKGIFKND